ncbi:MAG: hypothetical protein BalsKO_20940 [Balneolaceae bacterium]
MKKLLVLLFFSVLISQGIRAQVFIEKRLPPTILVMDIPLELNSSHLIGSTFKIETSSFLPSKKSFLLSSLKVFESLKFQSVLDQFNSTPMFDQRAYSPISVSDYNSYLSRNYQILNSSFQKVW